MIRFKIFAVDFLGQIAFLLLLLGAILLIGQIFFYLKSGVWTAFSPVELVGFFASGENWFTYPKSWFGFHAILSSLNAGISFLVCGALIFWIIILSPWSNLYLVNEKLKKLS
jgi:hypothetical protein